MTIGIYMAEQDHGDNGRPTSQPWSRLDRLHSTMHCSSIKAGVTRSDHRKLKIDLAAALMTDCRRRNCIARQAGQRRVAVVQPTKHQWHDQWFVGGQRQAPTHCPQLSTPLFSVPVCVRINRHQCRYPDRELLTQDWPGEVQHEAVCTVADFDDVQWHTKASVLLVLSCNRFDRIQAATSSVMESKPEPPRPRP